MNEGDVFQRYVSKMCIILARLWCIYISLDVQCPILLFFLLNICTLGLPLRHCLVKLSYKLAFSW
jgi:hypothetical protein